MRLPEAYRSLPRPSSAPKPNHPPGSVVYQHIPVPQLESEIIHGFIALRGDYTRLALPFIPRTFLWKLHYFTSWTEAERNRVPSFLGGDPAAGSPTATLLRLNPPCEAQIRHGRFDHASSKPHSGGSTGSVCKEQGRIHRTMMTCGY